MHGPECHMYAGNGLVGLVTVSWYFYRIRDAESITATIGGVFRSTDEGRRGRVQSSSTYRTAEGAGLEMTVCLRKYST